MKKLILNWILKSKFKALTDSELIDWALMEDKEREMYISQAKAIKEMRLFKDIMKHLKYSSQERMFNKSKDWEDMYFGKAMLYNVDLIEQFIETISKKNLK